jgi:hypothetical protein
MAGVFISYARKDKGFARDLHDALKDANRDPWVDWHSIPYSAHWKAAIFAAIEAADNFLFIISPPFESEKLFPGIEEIQWINYPEFGLKQTFENLITAIDVDADWVHQHTHGSKAKPAIGRTTSATTAFCCAAWICRMRSNGSPKVPS